MVPGLRACQKFLGSYVLSLNALCDAIIALGIVGFGHLWLFELRGGRFCIVICSCGIEICLDLADRLTTPNRILVDLGRTIAKKAFETDNLILLIPLLDLD